MIKSKSISIVGGGIAGIACALFLLDKDHNNVQISIFDQTSSLGKKFLVAGNGGLNLTHNEDHDLFKGRYFPKHFFDELLNLFSPTDFRKWLHNQGIETFIGTSGRIFPKFLNASEILKRWILILKENKNISIYLNHKLTKIINQNEFSFEYRSLEKKTLSKIIHSDITIFSLGGASWKRTGSDGLWTQLFSKHLIEITPFSAINCGFNCNWSPILKEKLKNSPLPLKNISLTIGNHSTLGEIMLTPYGIEGGAVYNLSKTIQNSLLENNETSVTIDLKPTLSANEILNKLKNKSRKRLSLSNFLRKRINLSKIRFNLLMELAKRSDFLDLELLAKSIKTLKIKIDSARPIDEAISCSGGINFSEIDQNFMLKKLPNCYVLGEVINWDAPTGGYLIQGCFSNAYKVANEITKT